MYSEWSMFTKNKREKMKLKRNKHTLTSPAIPYAAPRRSPYESASTRRHDSVETSSLARSFIAGTNAGRHLDTASCT